MCQSYILSQREKASFLHSERQNKPIKPDRSQKKGSKINNTPKTQNTDSSIIPLIPSRDRQGPPQSPVLPPKETSPRSLRDPPPDFFQMVFCMLAHTRQIAQIDPTRLIIHQLPRQKILVRLEIQQSMTTIVEHYHLPLPSLPTVLSLVNHILDHVSRLRSRNHPLRPRKRPRCLEHFILMIRHRPHHLPINQITERRCFTMIPQAPRMYRRREILVPHSIHLQQRRHFTTVPKIIP